ncbi:MAG: hypothetical protein Q9185_007168 [Variospora sp. 1 TL-2023]
MAFVARTEQSSSSIQSQKSVSRLNSVTDDMVKPTGPQVKRDVPDIMALFHGEEKAKGMERPSDAGLEKAKEVVAAY